MTTPLRTEADVVRALEHGTYRLSELYRRCQDAGETLTRRAGGDDVVQDGQRRWQRRVRNALQTLKQRGLAEPMGEGTWVLRGPRRRPIGALLVLLPHEPARAELVLADAVDLLRRSDAPLDLVIADPPYGLALATTDEVGERTYKRNGEQVVGGYVDVPPAQYAEFSERWVAAAATALRPGGYLAMVTGPEQTDVVMSAARRAGLTYVNRVVARRPFALRTTRRFAHAHHEISIVCHGPLDSSLRHFAVPPDLPAARSGAAYPLDLWELPKYERPGLLRYRTALHPTLLRRLVLALTRVDDRVADPFLGSGTTLFVCLEEGRRFLGGDVNAQALRFTIARYLSEWLPQQRQLQLAV